MRSARAKGAAWRANDILKELLVRMSELEACQRRCLFLDTARAVPPWPSVPAPPSSPLPSASLHAHVVTSVTAEAQDCQLAKVVSEVAGGSSTTSAPGNSQAPSRECRQLRVVGLASSGVAWPDFEFRRRKVCSRCWLLDVVERAGVSRGEKKTGRRTRGSRGRISTL